MSQKLHVHHISFKRIHMLRININGSTLLYCLSKKAPAHIAYQFTLAENLRSHPTKKIMYMCVWIYTTIIIFFYDPAFRGRLNNEKKKKNNFSTPNPITWNTHFGVKLRFCTKYNFYFISTPFFFDPFLCVDWGVSIASTYKIYKRKFFPNCDALLLFLNFTSFLNIEFRKLFVACMCINGTPILNDMCAYIGEYNIYKNRQCPFNGYVCYSFFYLCLLSHKTIHHPHTHTHIKYFCVKMEIPKKLENVGYLKLSGFCIRKTNNFQFFFFLD